MVNKKNIQKICLQVIIYFFLSSLHRFVPSSAASNYSNSYIQCVISHLKLYKHACKVFLHKPFQFVQIYFYKAFINWTKLHTHVLRGTSSSNISHEKKIPFPSDRLMLLIIYENVMPTSGCAILYFCLVNKNNDLLSPSDPLDKEVFWKKYSIRIYLQSTAKPLAVS